MGLVKGGRSLLLFQPIGPLSGREQGYIFAAVDPGVLLEQIIGDVAAECSLAISVDDEQVYRRKVESSASGGSPSCVLTFNYGRATWQVEIWSTPGRSGLAQLVPTAEAVLSFGLAAAVRQALRAQVTQYALLHRAAGISPTSIVWCARMARSAMSSTELA